MRKLVKLKKEDDTLKSVDNNRMNSRVKNSHVIFVTGNFHKFNEVHSVLSSMGIGVSMLRVKGKEIQSDNINEIAQDSAIDAFNKCHVPLIAEDAGLFIDVLEGFPGPYSAYVYKTIQNRGVLKLMETIQQNRKATFCSALVYYSQETGLKLFEGKVEGQITLTERVGNGNAGFGFDPIFQPLCGEKTFAEMSIEEKNGVSHRAMAVNKFAEWYFSTFKVDK